MAYVTMDTDFGQDENRPPQVEALADAIDPMWRRVNDDYDLDRRRETLRMAWQIYGDPRITMVITLPPGTQ